MIDVNKTITQIKDVLERADKISESHDCGYAEATGMLRGFLNIMIIKLELEEKNDDKT